MVGQGVNKHDLQTEL